MILLLNLIYLIEEYESSHTQIIYIREKALQEQCSYLQNINPRHPNIDLKGLAQLRLIINLIN